MAIATSTLATIENKVRLLTRSLSENQLSTDAIDQYINTFIAYDMPEHLRQINLRSTIQFFTIPGVDYYPSQEAAGAPNPTLYQLNQNYLTFHAPVYVAGFQAQFMEDRNHFFAQYPMLQTIQSIGVTGDGAKTRFSGVVNTSQNPPPVGLYGAPTQLIYLLQDNVNFVSQDVNGNGINMIDYPLTAAGFPQIGNLFAPGSAPTSTVAQDPNNYINYATGQFVVTFPVAPAVGKVINSQTVPQQVSMPLVVLFYDGAFRIRPVPDQVYTISMEAYVRPTQLLSTGPSTPQLEEWWQYIAYGAAKKVFQDRMDIDSVSMIQPELDMQQRLCLRRTIVQQTSQRVSSIYAENNGPGAGTYGSGWGYGGSNF